jgi:hypothetical protein
MKRRMPNLMLAILIIITIFMREPTELGAATTWTVDDDGTADFSTIQASLDAAQPGDTVLVADGVYKGEGNRDLYFYGKDITLRSANGPENCIIDCEEQGRGFYFDTNSRGTEVSGITITNGLADCGGAIYYDFNTDTQARPRPTFTNCIITGNRAVRCGGFCYFSAGPGEPMLFGSVFQDSRFSMPSGGIRGVSPTLSHHAL